MARKLPASPTGNVTSGVNMHNPDPAPAPIGHNNPPPTVEVVDPKFLKGIASKLQKIGAVLTDNKALFSASAKTRAMWQEYGQALADAREAIKSNKAFNTWLVENDLEKYASRNERTDAMWLANLDEDFLTYAVPANTNSPKSVRTWYRKTMDRVISKLGGGAELDDDAMSKAMETLTPEEAAFHEYVSAEAYDKAVQAYGARTGGFHFPTSSVEDAVSKLIAQIGKHVKAVEVANALAARIAAGGAALFDPEPTEPTEPTEPAEPVEPTEPVEPAATEPGADPVE